MEFNYVKIETFIPEEYVSALREELNKAGALTTDDLYDYCMAEKMFCNFSKYFSTLLGFYNNLRFITVQIF